jgi:predicted permease
LWVGTPAKYIWPDVILHFWLSYNFLDWNFLDWNFLNWNFGKQPAFPVPVPRLSKKRIARMAQILWQVLATVLPIFLIAACGFVYGRRSIARGQSLSGLEFANRVNIQVFAPALVFDALAYKHFSFDAVGLLALGGALIVILSGVLALPLCRIFSLDRRVLIPPVMYSNSGNLGIPLILLALGESMLPAAIILFVVEMVLHMSLGIYLLNRQSPVLSTLREPMIAATILGLLLGNSGFSPPEPLKLPITMLGQIAVPLMLFSLGIRMAQSGVRITRVALVGAIAAPVSGLVSFGLILWGFSLLGISLSPLQKSALILFAALPPAVMNYIVAERFNIAPEQVASIVVLGNLLALVFIPATLIYLHLSGWLL